MAASGPRFCPRCGTGRVGEMGFCPKCGLDLREFREDEQAPAGSPPDVRMVAPQTATGRHEAPPDRSAWLPLLAPGGVVLLLLVVAAWFAGFGPFGPGDGSGPLSGAPETPTATSPLLPPVTAQPSIAVPSGFTPPPVGLTILSPADGTVVGSNEATVIGTAPPGLRITQEISFGLDRHATTDGTGHWAIQAQLSEGENQLNFRIGDDRSTTETIRVIYVVSSAP